MARLLLIRLLCSFATCNAVCLGFAGQALASSAEHGPTRIKDTNWQRYVVAPTSRDVLAVRVLSSTGDVTNAQGVLGSGVAILKRVSPDVPPSVTVDFGKVVVGYPQISFAGSSGNNPGVRLAFSESLQYLTDRSDFTRSDYFGGPGTDQYAVPAQPVVWTDTLGCDANGKVCADGLHGFRYLKISLDALPGDAPDAQPYGEVDVNGISLDFTAYLGTPDTYLGWFDSSDPQLNQFWYDASYTDELVTDKFRSTDVDPFGESPSLDGKVVILDGAKRDRLPYVGDIAVSGRTDYLTHDVGAAVRNVLADLADHQRADGWIPGDPPYTLQLFDYPLWWVIASWDYVLYTGDTDYAAFYYPNLVKLLDSWCPSVTDSRELLDKGLSCTLGTPSSITPSCWTDGGGYADYAFLPRTGEVTYYNALYALALLDAARLATTLGQGSDASRWQQREARVASAINTYLWDPAAGAYLDSATGPARHGQDGNGLGILAGLASPSQAASALNYLASATAQPYGNAFMDNDTLVSGGSQRVYAFTSYLDIQARFLNGQADSAIDEIKRLYGWMAGQDPGTTDWEGIGAGGSLYEGAGTSAAHGWSTGVVPALTNCLLGVIPTGPGFATWIVQPHPGTVSWAQGQLPTPHGPLGVSWSTGSAGGRFTMTVIAPPGTTGDVAVPANGSAVQVRVDGLLVFYKGKGIGRRFGAQQSNGYVTLHGIRAGRHTITVSGSQ
jgi:hypothetical protein